MTQCPVPHHPADTGVDYVPSDFGHIEGSHLLANEARAFLADCGFTEDQILEWAETYLSRVGSGDVTSFIEWIHEQEALAAR